MDNLDPTTMNEIATNARCPECGIIRDATSPACQGCGLLFVTNAHLHRRESDLNRRAADLSKTSCPICRGTIEKEAMRCLHCGEILDPAYRAARARQLRSQINYASWIAYIMGFLMLFIFRPVGVIAIIAGLLLSIAYYAIRIPSSDDESSEQEEEQGQSRKNPRSRFARFLRRQFGVETIRLGSGRPRKFGLVVAGTPLLLVAIGWATNYTMLQVPIDEALSGSDFPVLEIAAHYEYFMIPGSVVLEIEKLGDPHNAERALTRIASEFRGNRVEIRFDDNAVRLDGDRFRNLSRVEIHEIVEKLHPHLAQPEDGRPTRQVRIPIE